jgi:ferrochelatase
MFVSVQIFQFSFVYVLGDLIFQRFDLPFSGARFFSSAQPKTGIVMFNMGGPSTTPEVEPFLNRLFSDPEIIPLPFQKWTSPLLVKRRLSRVTADYEQIGGSPIRKWTELQGRGMCERLDKLRPESAPHKFYVAFRYTVLLSQHFTALYHCIWNCYQVC